MDNFRSKKELEKLFARARVPDGGGEFCPADNIQEQLLLTPRSSASYSAPIWIMIMIEIIKGRWKGIEEDYYPGGTNFGRLTQSALKCRSAI